MIILEGYGTSQKIINLLNKDYPVYLETEGHKVKLNIKGTYKGMHALTQAIMVPEQKLISGKTYELKIDNLSPLDKSELLRWNSKLKKRETINWKVSGIDNSIPEFINEPKLLDKKTVQYGCGPAVYADFNIQTKDDSELLLKTELVDTKNGESTIYFLIANKSGKISVGHGMCSGAFGYKKDGQYKIRFSLMDICGNEGNNWTAWIKFESPYEGDY